MLFFFSIEMSPGNVKIGDQLIDINSVKNHLKYVLFDFTFTSYFFLSTEMFQL